MTNRKSTIMAPIQLVTALTLITSFAMLPVYAAEDGIYKTIGADGSTVFTDKTKGNSTATKSTYVNEQSNSEPFFDTSIRSDEFSSDTLGGIDNRKITINAVEIMSPTNNQTLVDLPGEILFQVSMEPDNRLPRGHSTEIQMNGVVVSTGNRKQLRVPNPEPGSYIFEARILDSKGETVVLSAPVKVNIEKTERL